MESTGWRMSKFAATLVAVAETAGGIGLLLGLLTPVAAGVVIAVMIDARAVDVSGGAF
jgi:putative oxidoreductase